MPLLSDPDKEAHRVEAVRAALFRDRRWERGAFYGNVSPEGLRRRGQNPLKSGTESIAFVLAVKYAQAIEWAIQRASR